MTAPNVMLESV